MAVSNFFAITKKTADVIKNVIDRNIAIKDKAKPPFIPSIPVREGIKINITEAIKRTIKANAVCLCLFFGLIDSFWFIGIKIISGIFKSDIQGINPPGH
jgi:hypothetical protein